VGHDPDVPGLLERELARHGVSLYVLGDSGKEKAPEGLAQRREATQDYSIRPMRYPTALQPLLTWFARHGLLVLAGLGALLLWSRSSRHCTEVRAVTAVPDGGSFSAGDHHYYALLLLAIVSVPMAYGAVIGARGRPLWRSPSLALVALFIIFTVDLPDVNEEGLIGETYDSAKASPQEGFWLEIVGSLVLLAGGSRGARAAPGHQAASRRSAREATEPEPVAAGG
jgi:hypothetical protein